ncbi:MBL fold metallo-hydrolase [Granulicella cerasi]|uniref:MBL fold metallo-hydrolase n=1 Tax=Granulicella cerasi TaxID=741063 RepID=A0ABW1Z829_9BACT|nr:MBL fold metallo-hydrolase [Granulicella cerasi]
MRLQTSLFAVASLLFAASTGLAQNAPPSPWKKSTGFTNDWQHLKETSLPLAPGVSLLHASGGNTLVLTGPDGTLLVDPSFAQVAPALQAKLKEMGASPVRFVIDSHLHADHSGANGVFHTAGATVIAQDNVRARMSRTQVSPQRTTSAAPADQLPTLTYDHSLHLYLDGENVVLDHLHPSHTDGDTAVFLEHANVVHLGDVFINGMYPYIDVNNGGNIDGYFPALDDVLARTDDKSKIIPGHGDLADKARLQFYRNMLKTVRDRVAAEVAKGATLEQIWATHPSHEFDAEWASDRITPEDFAAMIYQSLTGKRLDYKPGLLR